MSKFIAYIQGAGEGCDYTIGCNLSVYFLPDHIETMEQAVEFCGTPQDEDDFLGCSSEMVSQITVFEVINFENVDVGAVKAARKADRRRIANERKEQQERAELERLKARYEK